MTTRIEELRAARKQLERKDRRNAVLIGIGILVGFVALIIAGGLLTMVAWNFGVAVVFGLDKIGLVTALFFNLALAILGSFFRRVS